VARAPTEEERSIEVPVPPLNRHNHQSTILCSLRRTLDPSLLKIAHGQDRNYLPPQPKFDEMATTRGVITSVLVVGTIVGALYPIAVVPVLESKRRAARGESRVVRPVEPGFRKGSLWKEIEKH
jgi:hypothetical protein